jgi:hypothetical protein
MNLITAAQNQAHLMDMLLYAVLTVIVIGWVFR